MHFYDDFINKKKQTLNEKLCAIRQVFDDYNLISALHSYMSIKNENYKNLLPPLILLNSKDKKELLKKLETLKFNLNKKIAA